MIGDTATMGTRAARSSVSQPGTARMGSMLTKGFDGQITIAASSGAARPPAISGVGRARSTPAKANPVTGDLAAQADEIFLEGSDPQAVCDDGAHRRIATSAGAALRSRDGGRDRR